MITDHIGYNNHTALFPPINSYTIEQIKNVKANVIYCKENSSRGLKIMIPR